MKNNLVKILLTLICVAVASSALCMDDIYQAAASGYNAELAHVLRENDINARHPVLGRTALHCAATLGNMTALQQLLLFGANVHAQDVSGETPLHRAARTNELLAAELLIARGADIHAENNAGQTPLELTLPEYRLIILAFADAAARRENDGTVPTSSEY